MYTVYFLFKKSRALPNLTSSVLMIASSVVCALFSLLFLTPQAGWLTSVLAAFQIIILSVIYWLGMTTTNFEHHINSGLRPSGFHTSSLFAVEAAESPDKVYFDSPSSSRQVNFSAALLSPLPMAQLEAACSESGMGEYYCDVDDQKAADTVRRNSAAGRVSVVAWDSYDSSAVLEEADCVLLPNGTDSQGLPSVVHYDPDRFSTASNACGAFMDLASVIMGRVSRYYSYILGVAMIAQILHMCISVASCSLLVSSIFFCSLLFLELLLTVFALKRLAQPVSRV